MYVVRWNEPHGGERTLDSPNEAGALSIADGLYRALILSVSIEDKSGRTILTDAQIPERLKATR